MIQSFNPKQLKDVILRRLGAPVINIEVTEEQVYECIERALELYGEYHYNGLNKAYYAVKASDNTGVFDLSNTNIFAITSVVNTGGFHAPMNMGGGHVYAYINDLVLGLAGVTGSTCSQFSPMSFGTDLAYYTQLTQLFGTMREMFSPNKDFWYNDSTGQLKVMSPVKEGDVIVFEVYVKSFSSVQDTIATHAGYGVAGFSPKYNLSDQYNNPDNRIDAYYAGQENVDNQGSYNNRWVKDYATALVKEINGTILSKHQGMMLPGGVTIDGIRIVEEAKEEKRVLREELLLLDPPPSIILG